MACIEEIAKDAKFIKIEDQLLVLIRRQVETELMLKEKFRDICEEVSNFVKEGEDVVHELESNSGVTCEDEAKRRNSGAKTKTFEENCYLLLYAVSNKEDTAYQRQLITRIRVKYQFPIRRITLHLYVVCTVGHQSKICN
ncbi:hypothetical protein Tco_0345377 [Tanacetum coccineum]